MIGDGPLDQDKAFPDFPLGVTRGDQGRNLFLARRAQATFVRAVDTTISFAARVRKWRMVAERTLRLAEQNRWRARKLPGFGGRT